LPLIQLRCVSVCLSPCSKEIIMKKLLLAGLTMATLFTATAPVLAEPPSWAPANVRRDRDADEDRRDFRQDAWRNYRRYDYNHPGPQGAIMPRTTTATVAITALFA